MVDEITATGANAPSLPDWLQLLMESGVDGIYLVLDVLSPVGIRLIRPGEVHAAAAEN